MDALTEAIYKLKNFETGTLLQKNMVFMDYLQNGVPVKYYDKGEERSTLVYLVDFKNPASNEFTVANQWPSPGPCPMTRPSCWPMSPPATWTGKPRTR